MKKRIMSMLLALVMVLGLMPNLGLTAQATDTAVATVTTLGGETTNYTDLQKAIEAAQASSGSTLKLLDDVSTDTHFIVESGSFTIDLNGHTVTGTGASNANPSAFSIATNANTYTSALQITFTDSSEAGDGAVVSQNGSAVKVNAYALGDGVEVVLEKGSYHGNTYGLEVNTKKSNVTVQDGVSISATNTFGSAVAINGGVLTMNGGTLDGKSADFDFGARTATDATLDLSGCSDPDGMTIRASRAMPVAQVKLPDGYGIFGADNTQYAADATVERNSVVTIKSAKAVIYTVTVTADKTEATVGETVTLTAVVTDGDGYPVDSASVSWLTQSGSGLALVDGEPLKATIAPETAGSWEVFATYDPIYNEDGDEVQGSVTVTFTAAPLPGKVVVDGIDLVNGEADHAIECGEGTAVYDPDTCTLTLTNAEITTPSASNLASCGIYASDLPDDLTIVLVGENSIVLTDTAYDNTGIYKWGSTALIIQGSGSLHIELFDDTSLQGIGGNNGDILIEDATLSFAVADGSVTGGDMIHTNKTITLDNADISCSDTNYYQGITSVGNILIQNGSSVNVLATENAIYSESNVTIEDSAVTAEAVDFAAICVWGNTGIADSQVAAHSEWDNGLYCYGQVTISGGEVAITSTENDGFRANGGITVKDDAKITATGAGAAVFTNEILSVESGELTAKGGVWAILARRVSENGEGSKPADDPAAILLGNGLIEISGAAIKTEDWLYTEVWDDWDWEYYDKWMSRSYFVDENDTPLTVATISAGCMVTYSSGENGSGNTANDIKLPGVELTLKDAIFTRDNYTQTGWATTDGGEKAYDLKGSYTNDAEITLYPVWTAKTYKINYLGLEDGTINGDYPTTYTYGVGTTLPKDVTRDGYTFKGWSSDAVDYFPIGSIGTGASGDKYYYAHWEAAKEQLTAVQTVTEANWYPGMRMRVSNLEDFFTVTKADGSAFTMFDVAVTDSQGGLVEYLENAGTYTVTLTMGAYYQNNYTLDKDTFTFTVKPLNLSAITETLSFTALDPTYTGQTALPTATASGKLNFRVYIYNVFVDSEKMYSVDHNDGLWEFAAIDGKNSVEAGDAWANVVSKSSNIIGTYEYKYSIKQAEMEVPEGLAAVNETIDGKADGKITGLTTAMEYSTSKYGTYKPVTDVNMLFADDTYYVRTAAPSANHEPSDPVELTIAAGRKLTVTVPADQQNYTLTASKTELSWHGSTTLTIAFDAGYDAGEDFAVMVNNKPATLTNNKVTISDVEEDLVVTVTGVEANDYTVSFDANGGAAIDPITVTYGEKYGNLPSSAITGLSGGSKNWYLVDENGNVTDTNIKNLSLVETARDHTLFVKRSVLAPAVTITLEVPGAISNDYQYYVPGNSTRVLTATVGNKNDEVLDYTYQWYKDGEAMAGATEAVLTLAGNVSDSGTYKVVVTATLKDGSDIVVTANSASGEKEQIVKILHATNTLSYDANGGENAPGSHYTGGETITVAADAPSREHYTFAGWNTKADGTGSSYSAGSTYTFAEDNGNGGCEATLYAQWTANTYAVTLETNRGTIREGDVTKYTYGVGAKLPTAVTRPGYRFVGWYDNEDCEGEPVTEITATDHGDKTFYAKWKKISSGSSDPTYPPIVDNGDNGDVKVSPRNPEEGDVVVITPDPDPGYEVDDVIVTDENGRPIRVIDNGDGTYSFKQPDGKVEITVTFKEIGADCERDYTCPMYGYTDLDRYAWYHDGVHFCLENDLMNGVSSNRFDPNGTTTRAMIVTILWRLEGEPVVNYAMDFSDVAANMWYTEAIRWAASEGIVEGYGDTFGPNDPITREQMAAIMWRYAKYKGYDVSVGENTNILSYDDAFDVSDWAIPAMQWACGAGLINGIADGNAMNLEPQGNATRAQAANILQRFIGNVVDEE